MQNLSQRIVTLAIAALTFAIIGFAMPKSASAAPVSSGIADSVNAAKGTVTDQVQYRRRYYRRGYYHRPYYRPIYRRPVYYGRRCFWRSRLVATPYGLRRRMVRVCR